MNKMDQIGGAVWTLLGIGFCLGSFKLKIGGFHNPGAGFIPFLAGLLLISLGIILAISNATKKREPQNRNASHASKRNYFLPFMVGILFIAYILVSGVLGFLPATFFFLFSLFEITAPREWLMSLLISLSATISGYLIFSFWLGCPLPKGLWGF
jgi:hypothetical protein